jgi:hypothetical protein
MRERRSGWMARKAEEGGAPGLGRRPTTTSRGAARSSQAGPASLSTGCFIDRVLHRPGALSTGCFIDRAIRSGSFTTRMSPACSRARVVYSVGRLLRIEAIPTLNQNLGKDPVQPLTAPPLLTDLDQTARWFQRPVTPVDPLGGGAPGRGRTRPARHSRRCGAPARERVGRRAARPGWRRFGRNSGPGPR